MKRYFVEASEITYTTRERDESDSWDQGDRDGYVDGVRWFEQDVNYEGGYESLPNFAVVVGYRTGSTFGSDFASEVVDCFDDAGQANGLAEFIDQKYGNAGYGKVSEYSFTFNDKEYFAHWEGYFERFQSVQVYPINQYYRSSYR